MIIILTDIPALLSPSKLTA